MWANGNEVTPKPCPPESSKIDQCYRLVPTHTLTLFNGPQTTCLYQAGQGPPAFSKVQGSPPKAPPYRVAALLDGLKIHHMRRDLNFLGGETWYERVKAPAKQPP
jgi:hypothetical protein